MDTDSSGGGDRGKIEPGIKGCLERTEGAKSIHFIQWKVTKELYDSRVG
jgi:hypothetical protein